MTASTGNLFTRNDTLLGVCEGLGEEFGFHPNYLRVALAASLLWNPVVVVAAYLAAGVVLMLARWLMPVRRHEAEQAEQPTASNDEGQITLAEAA